MASFIIECPDCGTYTTASKILHRKVTCGNCGREISVKRDKIAVKECPRCHNNVVFDQSKGDKAVCPVCKEPINTAESKRNALDVHCPSCSCVLVADKNAAAFTCPLCDTTFDVQKQIAKETAKKKGFASVIKYEGGNDVFVWKHPIEDFNMGSQLIVHESQEALFFRDGQALDLFGSGRYTLATQNLPILENIYNLHLHPEDVFHSEVYFINMTTQMGIKWGTDSKVRLFDPASGLHIELGAFGQFSLRVRDSRKFILKVVGTAEAFLQEEVMGVAGGSWNCPNCGKADLDTNFCVACGTPRPAPMKTKQYGVKSAVAHFKSLVTSKVKAYLAKAIKENSINILEVDERTDDIAAYLKEKINEVLDEYGLEMPDFYISNIATPDDDKDFQRLKKQFAEKTLLVRQEEVRKAEAAAAQERKLVEAQTEAQLKLVSAQGEAEALKLKAQAEAEAYKAKAMAEAAEMQAKGYTYSQETARMVGMEAMQNGLTGGEGGSVGGLGDVASLGVALGAMGGVIGMTKDALSPIMGTSQNLGKSFGNVVAGNIPDTWDCACGVKGISGNFCSNCGGKKPSADTWDCACGVKGISGNFCSNCGGKKPSADTWDCACGAKGISGNFCSNCGGKKPLADTWDCECGQKNITGKFCNNCGKPATQEV